MTTYAIEGGQVCAVTENGNHALRFSEIANSFDQISEQLPFLGLRRAVHEVCLNYKEVGGETFKLGLEVLLKHRRNIYQISIDGSTCIDYVICENLVLPIGFQDSDALNVISDHTSKGPSFCHDLQIRDIVFVEKLASAHGIELGASELRDTYMVNRLNSLSEFDFGLAIKPYPYQAIGIQWLCSQQEFGQSGVILADVMGLGKTLQGIGLVTLNAQNGQKDNLIICPNSLVENWKREIGKFSPGLSLLVHAGTMRTGLHRNLEGFDVVVTSYDSLISDFEILKKVNWNVVILDEAQYIKNPEARRSKAAKKLPRKFSVAISGTPIENKLLDLWSISDFVDSTIFGTRNEFENTFGDSVNSSLLVNERIRPFMLRRNLIDVNSQLPEKVVSDIPLIWPTAMNEIYENVRREAILEFATAGGLVATGRLRKLTTHPLLMEIGPQDPCKLSPKFEMTIELLRKISDSGEKALIFSSFLEMTDLLVEYIRSNFENVFVGSMDGRTEVSDRQPLIDDFNEYQGFGVLVCNPIVAGVGLNITGANHVIHYNLEWNPAKEDQATFRVYRPGQTRVSFIHRLFYLDTIDEVIDQRIQLKRELSDLTIDTEIAKKDFEEALRVSPVKVSNG
jgi:SNF2 family DNA or RNA helicase